MIQGTMSNAGKSLIVAGLCRIMKQDGYKAAPFKSQNMALNSFITEEGLEMGRAQVVQAEAAGVKPSVLMNPILLKPTSDMGSQVIVNGEVKGNMSAKDYFKYKHNLIPEIKKAFETLSKEYDIIVIEGAGSPAEINLKSEDIVNMGMAKIAQAPVLLAGDIDRGGVFAQLVGTIILLEEAEKAMIKGLLINKFRGDKSILQPGLQMLEDRCGIPVTGVIPYMYVDIEDEDSLSDRFTKKKEIGQFDIGVIRLPRISNFTDFNSLEALSEVTVRYISQVSEMKSPDMIIIPGTKNTMEDLLWLRQSGLEAEILKQKSQRKIIFGICGGYQMLGATVSDPYGVEKEGTMKGMELLPVATVLEPEKTRTRVRGKFKQITGSLENLSHAEYEGYEIHMGTTKYLEDGESLTDIFEITTESGKTERLIPDGAVKDNVYGTYIHGIFDSLDVRNGILSSLYKMKGIELTDSVTLDLKEYKEKQYDILADTLRKNIDMEAVYKIIEEGIKT